MKENKINKKRLVLLDSHAIIHRAYHGMPEFTNSHGLPTGGLFGLCTMLIRIISELKPDYIVSTYDLPKPTHRHEAFEGYKGTRAKTEDDLVIQLQRSREIFDCLNIPIYDAEGFEADDILGTIVDKLKNNKNIEIIIASGDMDTLQLVRGEEVRVYTLKKGNETFIYDEKGVNEKYGFGPDYVADYKGLRGDPGDNIPGVKGVGEVIATSLIKNFGHLEEIYAVLKKDKEKLLDKGIKERIVNLLIEQEEEAEFSKLLGTIRRDAPIEFSLPKNFKEDISLEKVAEKFNEFEFRLMPRFKDALSLLSGENKNLENSSEETEEVKEIKKIDERKLKEAGIMLWVLDSNKTLATLEDIKLFTGEDSFDKAYKILEEMIDKKDEKKVYKNIEEPLIDICLEMKERGVKVDVKYLKEQSRNHKEELKKLETKIVEYAGEEFNIASPKQLSKILFEKLNLVQKRQKKTSTGQFSTNEKELEKLKDLHPIINLILEYRERNKLITTYLDTIPEQVDKENKVHADLFSNGSTTGRMSSQNPNLQNIPNKNEWGRDVRKAFEASSGYKLVAFDYSQIELRIAAFLSQDEKMIEIFRKGDDIHSSVASLVFRVGKDEVTKEMRRRAKIINFGIIYGMGINALKENLEANGEKVARSIAEEFYKNYFETFSTLAEYLNKIKLEANRLGYTETYFGRKRYFEGLKSHIPYIRAAAERMAINAPIQGTGADIVKLAMIETDKYLKENKLNKEVRLILQVHDELVYEVKKDLVGKVVGKIKDIMENVIDPKEINGIKCLVEAKVGDNWVEMEKILS